MQKYIGTAIKKDVNNPAPAGETPAANVDVRVLLTSTGQLATIYSDNGSTVIDQTIYKTDANGNHEFYAANGRYTIRYALPNGNVEYTDVSLFDIDDYTPPSGGEVNTSSNAGAGVQLALPKSGVDLPFRTLLAGAGVTLTQNADNILIEVNVPTFKTQSTHTKLLSTTTSLVITPPGGGRVSIENLAGTSNNTNDTFSIDVDGVDFIAPGSLTLAGQTGNTSLDDAVKVGINSGNGGVSRWIFGVDEVVTLNKGAGNNIVCSYNIEVPDA